MNHTPGPWEIWSGANTHCFDGIIRSPHSPNAIAFVDADVTEIDDDVVRIDPSPNARLIAAAPELLEALRNCIEFIEDAQIVEAQWHWEPVKQARAAIAKATGKEMSR